jgi:hypothetical protein
MATTVQHKLENHVSQPVIDSLKANLKAGDTQPVGVLNLDDYTQTKQAIATSQDSYTLASGKLEGVKKEIRLIDPKLVGEVRYFADKHWRITNLVIDVFYFCKGLFYRKKLTTLDEQKVSHEVITKDVEAKIEKVKAATHQIRDRILELKSSLRKNYAGLEIVDDKIRALDPKVLNESRSPVGAAWYIKLMTEASYAYSYARGTMNTAQLATLAKSKATIEGKIEADLQEIAPLEAAIKPAEKPVV